ncbi:serine/arginine repetitive matrix protein 1-like [Pseudomyrmex gracilis]|uniref:serine/arginine repetitive matrix protein 1-like n=1 Tax=Pseudomyrmex gracilis TaxID=219809 RepID=UPI0009949CD9|nr:serine/arginine repetitive matrix protein 1-like [Pseudomyrmex gracilis]
MELRTEKELAEEIDAMRVSTHSAGPRQPLPSSQAEGAPPPRSMITRDMSTSQVVGQAAKMAEAVRKLATKLKNLKGTFVRQFKKAATGLEKAVSIVAGWLDLSRKAQPLDALNTSLSAEVSRLRDNAASLEREKGAVQAKMDNVLRENGRLQGEVDALHGELRDLRRNLMSLRKERLKEAGSPKKRPSGRQSPPPPAPSPRVVTPPPGPSVPPEPEGPWATPLSPVGERQSPLQGEHSVSPVASRAPTPPPRRAPPSPKSLREVEGRIMDAMRSQLSIFWEQISDKKCLMVILD